MKQSNVHLEYQNERTKLEEKIKDLEKILESKSAEQADNSNENLIDLKERISVLTNEKKVRFCLKWTQIYFE